VVYAWHICPWKRWLQNSSRDSIFSTEVVVQRSPKGLTANVVTTSNAALLPYSRCFQRYQLVGNPSLNGREASHSQTLAKVELSPPKQSTSSIMEPASSPQSTTSTASPSPPTASYQPPQPEPHTLPILPEQPETAGARVTLELRG